MPDYHGYSQRGYYSLVPSHVYGKLLEHCKQKPLYGHPYETSHYLGRLERFSY